MRRLTPKHIQKKKDRKNQLIVGFILMGVMVLGTLGFAFTFADRQDVRRVIYNGYEFVDYNGYWVTEVGGMEFLFTKNPNELKEISAEVNPLINYQGKPLYFVSEESQAIYQISINLGRLVLRMNPACLDEDCEEDFPIKTCNDNLIIIQEAEISEIFTEDNCVFIKGPNKDLLELTDIFLLKTIGIR
jgi:hypothetical protein